ncbi:MAG: hypothetical protein NC828_06030 [Candidatus Omnitrophica bacterium]|nr:hypothetical protein [Candidatus Omnitrophota bacterium]
MKTYERADKPAGSLSMAVTKRLTAYKNRPAANRPLHQSLLILLLIIYILLWPVDYKRWNMSWGAEDISNIPVEVNGDQVQYFEAEKKVIGEGNVVVTYKDVKMTCKKVTAFLESKDAIAEGDVLITRGEDVLKGNKIIYNFQAETGTILDGAAKSGVWYGGGREVKKTSPQEVAIRDGYITTCDLTKPNYKIHAKNIKIYLGKRVVARNVTFNIGGVPVLYLPVYSQPVKENFPKVTFVPGRDKNRGTYLLSSYRYNLSDDIKGNLHLDYYQYKGFGEGLDYGFKTKDFGKGYIRAYYIDERDQVKHTEKERWRVQYRHKWEIQPETVGILEYHRFKDRDFIKDYFYREEFEREKQPASYAYLIHAKPNYVVSILAQERINRFFTETERFPEIELNIRNQRLLEKLPFFYKADFDAVNLNKKMANSNQDNNAIRIDTYNQLSIPVRLIDFLSVDPYVGTKQTFYTRENLNDEERSRGALYSGVDFSTNFYGIYNYKTNFLNLDINGIRHIFTPNISYYYVQKPTLAPDRLFEFDDVDKLDKKNGIGLTFGNKLQTKRFEENKNETIELARFIVGTDYLFHLDEGNRLSDVSSDLELKPYKWLFMKQAALYDPKWDDLKSLNTDVVAKDPKDKWRLGLGHRYEEKFSSQLTTDTEVRVTPKWKFRIFEMYEFKGDDVRQQEYSITRDLHCWEVEFSYSVRDAHTFWVIFRLKAFPEMPLKLGTTYYKPRTGSVTE